MQYLLGWLRYWWGIVWQDVEDVREGVKELFRREER